MGIGGVNVPLEEKSRDAQVASYTGIYDTEGVPHTKSGERQPIQVNMQVRGPPRTDVTPMEESVAEKYFRANPAHSCCPLCFPSVFSPPRLQL